MRLHVVLCLAFASSQFLGQGTSSAAQHLFEEALRAQQQGDDERALSEYQELLQLDPGAVGFRVNLVRVNLGATLAHMGRFDEAIHQYRLVLAKEPGNLPVSLNLAFALKEKGDMPAALRLAESLHNREPGDPRASMLFGDCLVKARRYPDAISVLLPLEAAHPDDLDLEWILGSAMIDANRTEEGVLRIERVAAKSDSAEAYLLAGQTRLGRNEYDLARKDADAALRINPRLDGVQTLNGMILQHTGDIDGAAAALVQALTVDDNNFNAHLYLGAILFFRRDLKGARVHLERAISLQPAAPRPRYELALVSRSEGNLNAALSSLETLGRQSPEWLEPHVELASLYYRLKRPVDGDQEHRIVDRLMEARQRQAIGLP